MICLFFTAIFYQPPLPLHEMSPTLPRPILAEQRHSTTRMNEDIPQYWTGVSYGPSVGQDPTASQITSTATTPTLISNARAYTKATTNSEGLPESKRSSMATLSRLYNKRENRSDRAVSDSMKLGSGKHRSSQVITPPGTSPPYKMAKRTAQQQHFLPYVLPTPVTALPVKQALPLLHEHHHHHHHEQHHEQPEQPVQSFVSSPLRPSRTYIDDFEFLENRAERDELRKEIVDVHYRRFCGRQ